MTASTSQVLDTRSGELVPQSGAPMNLFGASEPEAVIEHATRAATALAQVIEKQQLFRKIGGKRHVYVEAWTLLGSMMGVFPIVAWSRPLLNEEGKTVGWEARCEARTRAGELVGAAEAECRRAEANWRNRDSYALRSMAQTRATSKALKGPLGFVVSLAGFNATPAEELDGEAKGAGSAKATQAQQKKLHALIADLEKNPNIRPPQGENWEEFSKLLAREQFSVASRGELTKQQMSELLEAVEKEAIPF